MEKKITKKEMFAQIREVVADNADMVAFIDHEIELLDRHKTGSRKPTATQIANEGIKDIILSVLTDKGQTVSEIMRADDALKELSNQKITALLKQMCDSNIVIRDKDKKTTLFKLAEPIEVDTID